MNITKQLLEEMVKEELNEGKLQDFLGALGIAGTVAGLGVAGTEIAADVENDLVKDSVEKLQQMDQAEVDELRSQSPQGNETINKVWAQYDLTAEPAPSADLTGEPQPSWNENKSRLERLIAEELRKALKA